MDAREAIEKVPVAYLQVNSDTTVRAAIRSGVREVPGLRIWNDAKAFCAVSGLL